MPLLGLFIQSTSTLKLSNHLHTFLICLEKLNNEVTALRVMLIEKFQFLFLIRTRLGLARNLSGCVITLESALLILIWTKFCQRIKSLCRLDGHLPVLETLGQAIWQLIYIGDVTNSEVIYRLKAIVKIN